MFYSPSIPDELISEDATRGMRPSFLIDQAIEYG